MKTEWYSYGGYITNGAHKLKLDVAYNYIVYDHFDKKGRLRHTLADKKIAMRELRLTKPEYNQFRRLISEKLDIPKKLCRNMKGE